jgi:ribokinase
MTRALLVFGSINLDLSLPVPRLPAVGETLLGGSALLSPGGKGANQAHAARRYGAVVRLAGAVGDDALADAALAGLKAAGVDLTGVRRLPGQSTGVALIQVTPGGDNAIAVGPGANARVKAADVDDAALEGVDLLLQGEVPLAESMALARRARARGARVTLNLAPAHEAGALDPAAIDRLVVNEVELQMLTASAGPLEATARARDWAARHGVTVIVTHGADGASLHPPDGPSLAVPASPTAVVDTTGAGDAFCGVLAAALALGEPLSQALHRAVLAGSWACRSAGAQCAQPDRARVLAAEVDPTLLQRPA